MNKIAELKVNKGSNAKYHIISEGNTNPVLSTHNLETARMIRDQLEDAHTLYLNELGMGNPIANRYSIVVN
jgi:hypothetical protein|tara:strand:+ start:229 stop:441 length:213 start_codon:yes stop_codon:yes gene_type:complete